MELVGITIGDIADQLEETRVKAMYNKIIHFNAAISAIMGKAKLLGYLEKKVACSDEKSVDDLRILELISDEELAKLEVKLLSLI